jgi:arylsulfatase A-like enzyme
MTDNHPLRGGKSTLYEGGIRVPLIARWPGRIETGSRSDTPAIHVDLFPTFLELAGVDRPDGYPLDGVSLVPLLLEPSNPLPRDAIYWHMPGYKEMKFPDPVWNIMPVSVIRSGDFKLFEFLEDGRLELYDLKRDIGERRDLAAEMPERAAQLRASLAAWRQSIGAAMPERGPAVD